MAVVEQPVEHGGDRGAVAEQFSPVFHRAVGSKQRAGAFAAAHDDLQQLFCIAQIYSFDEHRQIVHVDAPRPELLLRYGSSIERQIDRTLNQIERLQRMRKGMLASAPVKVDLSP
jgi:hypothetical protein